MAAAETTLVAGMVRVAPLNVPKLAGLPLTAEFESVQLAEVSVNAGFSVSVSCACVLSAVTAIAVGEAGAATPMDDVEILAGVLARLVWVKLNGPPFAPSVVLVTATLAGFGVLVKVQEIASP